MDKTAIRELAFKLIYSLEIQKTQELQEAIDLYLQTNEIKKNAAKKYIVNDSCIRCGICAKVCPADNITVNDKVVFSDHCENCYACLHNCPKNAIHLKNERSTVRFRNEHVTLKDIISANE